MIVGRARLGEGLTRCAATGRARRATPVDAARYGSISAGYDTDGKASLWPTGDALGSTGTLPRAARQVSPGRAWGYEVRCRRGGDGRFARLCDWHKAAWSGVGQNLPASLIRPPNSGAEHQGAGIGFAPARISMPTCTILQRNTHGDCDHGPTKSWEAALVCSRFREAKAHPRWTRCRKKYSGGADSLRWARHRGTEGGSAPPTMEGIKKFFRQRRDAGRTADMPAG